MLQSTVNMLPDDASGNAGIASGTTGHVNPDWQGTCRGCTDNGIVCGIFEAVYSVS